MEKENRRPYLHVDLTPFGEPLKGESQNQFEDWFPSQIESSHRNRKEENIDDSKQQIVKKNSNKLTEQVRENIIKQSSQNQSQILKDNSGLIVKSTLRKNRNGSRKWFIKQLMYSKYVQYFLFFLIVIYVLLIFTTLVIDDFIDKEDQEKSNVGDALLQIEIIILVIFIIEIFLKSYGFGFRVYFRDKWLFLDTFIIIASITLVLIDMLMQQGKTFSIIAGVVRGVFRFLRLFLVLRKLQTAKKIKTSSKWKTPAEKIVEILQDIRMQFDQLEIISDIDWCVQMLESNKLFQIMNVNEEGKQQDETNKWIDYGRSKEPTISQNVNNLAYQEQISACHKNNKNFDLQNLRRGTTFFKNKQNLPFPLNLIKDDVLSMFSQIDELTFNCFELKKISNNQELKYLLLYLFQQNELFSTLRIPPLAFINFITTVQSSYIDSNPYHNRLHAFDVTQTVNFFLKKCRFFELANLSFLDVCTVFIAASCHDYGHLGCSNQFLVQTKHQLAYTYNDNSVLENFHIASLFKQLYTEEQNFIEQFDPDQKKQFREVIISCILATDMSKHFADIAKAKVRLAAQDFNLQTKDKQICMEIIVHSSDISNPMKTFEIYQEWTSRIMQEFWRQGDQEKQLGLPISYLCDRFTTNTAKAQGGFIDFVVRPLLEVTSNFLPDFEQYLQNLNANKEQWKQLENEYEEKLKQLNQQKSTDQLIKK